MLKERIALSLLTALIITSLLNIAYITSLSENIINHIDTAEELSLNENFNAAEEQLQTALTIWEKNRLYTGIFLRHPDVDNSYDVFYDLLAEIQQKQKDSMPALCEKLRYHIGCIADMEGLSLSSIF